MLKLSLTASGLLDKSRLDAWSRQKQAAIHKDEVRRMMKVLSC